MASQMKPKAILKRRDLTREEKIALLREWDSELRELMVADDENMRAPTPLRVTLQEVEQALAALGARHPVYATPTRHG